MKMIKLNEKKIDGKIISPRIWINDKKEIVHISGLEAISITSEFPIDWTNEDVLYRLYIKCLYAIKKYYGFDISSTIKRLKNEYRRKDKK